MSPTLAWIVASAGGAAGLLRLVFKVLHSRTSKSPVRRLPLMRAMLRLATLHYYGKAEARFLKAEGESEL